MQERTFYRALMNPEAVEWWKRGFFLSSHVGIPAGEWIGLWHSGHRDAVDFPLAVGNCVYQPLR